MQTVSVKLSHYSVEATNTHTGEYAVFEVEALDAGEALEIVESGGIFAADDAILIDEEGEA